MDYVYAFNAFEALLWFSMAFACVLTARRKRGFLKRPFTAATVFVVFAMSEMIEMRTGAWWRPLWLMFLKGGCIVLLASFGIEPFRAARSESR